MKLGIVGLPNVGKSTLFNAITNAGAQSANYPFCTIEPNIGVCPVPDERLGVLTELNSSEKTVPAYIEFVDIAGLVAGASKGEGLGNKFLSHIRQVDAILHVVRCFEDDNIIHVDGTINPLNDVKTINYELILSDIEMLDRRIDKVKKSLKGDKKFEQELKLLERLHAHLDDGFLARTFPSEPEEKEIIDTIELLSAKPVIYIANLSENDFLNQIEENKNYQLLIEYAKSEGAITLPVCGKIEEEISSLPDEEKGFFLNELGLKESGLDRIIKASYSLLGLISYLTSGPQETRAWTIARGTKAPDAAGKIHTDFKRGFIRAETIAYDDLMAAGSMSAAKEKGLIRSEGKDYEVKDGDIILFRFNV